MEYRKPDLEPVWEVLLIAGYGTLVVLVWLAAIAFAIGTVILFGMAILSSPWLWFAFPVALFLTVLLWMWAFYLADL